MILLFAFLTFSTKKRSDFFVNRYHRIDIELDKDEKKLITINQSFVTAIFPDLQSLDVDVFNSDFKKEASFVGKFNSSNGRYGIHCGKYQCSFFLKSYEDQTISIILVSDMSSCDQTFIYTSPKISFSISNRKDASLSYKPDQTVCFIHSPQEPNVFSSSLFGDDGHILYYFYDDMREPIIHESDSTFTNTTTSSTFFIWKTDVSSGIHAWKYQSQGTEQAGIKVNYFKTDEMFIFSHNGHQKVDIKTITPSPTYYHLLNYSSTISNYTFISNSTVTLTLSKRTLILVVVSVAFFILIFIYKYFCQSEYSDFEEDQETLLSGNVREDFSQYPPYYPPYHYPNPYFYPVYNQGNFYPQ